MRRFFKIYLILIAVLTSVPVQAQWWGSDALPGNSDMYTYRTRFGHWQFGGGLRNVATSQRFADRGIIRNWEDGMPIAVDRNIPGGRFSQPGVPNLVYVPRIDYYDNLGYLTDFRYREGLRQYWPEDGRLLIDQWEQITYEPEHLPASDAASAQPSATPRTSQKPVVIVAQPQSRRPQTQAVVIRQVPTKPKEPKLTYHQQIMQTHAKRRAAEEERQQQIQQTKEQQDELLRVNKENVSYTENTQYTQQRNINPTWFRDAAAMQNRAMPERPSHGGMPFNNAAVTTYAITPNPVLELEKRLEYSLVQSSDVSFYSPFRAKFENGTVTLTGTVGSEQERLAAERILLAQPEVQHVQNNLRLAE